MNKSTKYFRACEASDVRGHYWLVRLQGKGLTRVHKRGYGEMWVMTGVKHGERGARKHSAEITLEQGRVNRGQYDTRGTYGGRICKQYRHYNAQTGYAWIHVLYVLPLLPTYRATVHRFLAHRSLPVASRYYRTMLESMYLQKNWLSLPKSAECHLSWIHNHSNRATYITSHATS